jgi:hypothetical protein
VIRLAIPLASTIVAFEEHVTQNTDRQPDMKIESSVNPNLHPGRPAKPFSRLKRYLRWKLGEALHKIRYRNFQPSYNGDAVVCGMNEYVAPLAAYLECGNIELFLKRLTELAGKLLSKSLRGRALFVPELDELARKASLILAPQRNSVTTSKVLVHVATEVRPVGGHTHVIEDIAALLPDHEHVLILTGMDRSHPNLISLKSRLEELRLNVRLLHCSSRAEKARELSSLIGVLDPCAVLLMANHDDAIAYSAVAGHATQRVLFLHHADHQPSLGATRLDYTHIDLTPACHAVCASHPDLQASLLNLTVEDIGTVQLTQRRPLIGVTCGSPHKYAGVIEFSYAELLNGLFSAGVARIFHIADMPGWQRDQIRADIVAKGQDPNRLVFLSNTLSLAKKLMELSPDFYLTSHPLGGGKATVEALSVGLPILFVCPTSRFPLLGPDMTFGTSINLSALGQIPAAIHRLESDKKTSAKRSREIYEKYYSTTAFREGLLSAINLDSTKSGPRAAK